MTDNVIRPRHPQPMQPIVMATDGVLRFQPNAIVQFIVNAIVGDTHGPAGIVTAGGTRITFNDLMAMPWTDADRDHFNQLHGYSVSGLPWCDKKLMAEADRIAERVARKHPGRGRRRSRP